MVCSIISLDSNELEYEPRKHKFGAQAFDHYFIYCRPLEYKGVSFTPVEGGGWSKLSSSLEYQTHLPQMPDIFFKAFFYPEWPFGYNGPSNNFSWQSFYIVRRTKVASFPLLHPFIQQRLIEFLMHARQCSTEDTIVNKTYNNYCPCGVYILLGRQE